MLYCSCKDLIRLGFPTLSINCRHYPKNAIIKAENSFIKGKTYAQIVKQKESENHVKRG